MHTTRPTIRAAILLCTLGILTLGGCPTGTFTPADLPAEIKAVIAARDSVQIAEDDPALSATPGRVVDALSGLDGCWASYTSFAPPAGTPAPLAARDDVYTYVRFDAATGQMTNLIYGELAGTLMADLATYKGTFTITGDDRLTFHVDEFTTLDSLTGKTYVYPESFVEQAQQSAANGDITEAELADLLAGLAEPLVFDYRVTLDGDQVTLVSVWQNDDGTEGSDDPQVCFRFTCPD